MYRFYFACSVNIQASLEKNIIKYSFNNVIVK